MFADRSGWRRIGAGLAVLALGGSALAQTAPIGSGDEGSAASTSASVGGKLWTRVDAVLKHPTPYQDQYEWRNKFLLQGESLLNGDVLQRVHLSLRADWNARQSDETRYDEDVSLWEGYADLTVAGNDLRLGQQIVHWGRADVSLLDVLNPPDLTEMLFIEDELAKLPVPMALGTHYFDWGKLQAVWIPFYVPARLVRVGTNWSPIPSSSLADLENQGADVEEIIRDQSLPETRDYPPLALWNGSGGLRLSGHAADFDWGTQYVYTWSAVPYFEFSPTFLATVQQQPPSSDPLARIGGVSFLEFFNHDPRAGDPLFREHPVRQSIVGADGATTWGRAALRGEVAGFLPTVVYSENLDLLERPALAASLGVDGNVWGDLYGNVGGVVNWILATEPESYLFARPVNVYLAGFLREPLLEDRLTAEVRVLYDATMGDGALSPRLSWSFSDAWSVLGGLNVLWGAHDSPLGYFQDSGYAYAGLRLAF